MASFYLDIETQGLDSEVDKIITIQYQKLKWGTNEPDGPLVILKSWESSEKEILEQFQQKFGIEQWGFVAFGYNLHFENKFLYERSIACGLKNPIKLFDRPTVDLHSVGILMNNGFKGSGLDNITSKKGNGLACLVHYNAGNYAKVIQYIEQETKAYLHFLVWLTKHMPKVLLEYQVDLI